MPLLRLNIRGRLASYDRPVVMGIVNVTPDSFYAPSRAGSDSAVAQRAETLLANGADMLDIGAYSTRPGAADVSASEEIRRLAAGIAAVRRAVGDDIPLSVDTFRADVARQAVDLGADIVNDISGGTLDPDMFATVANLRVPYILMHTRGTPQTMQSLTDYSATGGDVAAGVVLELSARLAELQQLGVADVIVDPGFGFAKTLEQNYNLLRNLRQLQLLERPVLVGVSRKSMATRLLGITAEEALNATTALHVMALERGAAILRVHDAAPARQAIAVWSMTMRPGTTCRSTLH